MVAPSNSRLNRWLPPFQKERKKNGKRSLSFLHHNYPLIVWFTCVFRGTEIDAVEGPITCTLFRHWYGSLLINDRDHRWQKEKERKKRKYKKCFVWNSPPPVVSFPIVSKNSYSRFSSSPRNENRKLFSAWFSLSGFGWSSTSSSSLCQRVMDRPLLISWTSSVFYMYHKYLLLVLPSSFPLENKNTIRGDLYDQIYLTVEVPHCR